MKPHPIGSAPRSSFSRRPGATGKPARRRASRARVRVRVEGLEARALLTTFYVVPGGSESGPGTIGAPFGSIQAAVTAASSGDQIRVAAGTYAYDPAADHFGTVGQTYSATLGASPVVGILGKKLSILGGFTPANWSASDPVNHPTVIDGQGAHRGIFLVGTAPASLDLEGFTVQNAVATGIASRGGTEAVYAFGGGVFADMGGRQGDTDPWVFRNDIFRNDKAIASGALNGEGGRAAGGAVALRYVVNTTFDNVVFDGNQAIGAAGSDAGGGGLGGAIHADHSNIVGTNLTFVNNFAISGSAPNGSGTGRVTGESADGLGGALAAIVNSSVTLNTVTATNNLALGGNAATKGGSGFGGAFYLEGPGVTLNLTRGYVRGNKAQGGSGTTGGLAGGGAVETHNAGLILDSTQILANSAQGGDSTNGGASGNVGGGGLYLTVFAGTAPNQISNSVIADNSTIAGAGAAAAAGGGGGIWFQGATATLGQDTIDNNRIDPRQAVGQGLLVLDGSNVTVFNSIISDHNQNGSSGGAVDVLGSGLLNLGRNLSFNNPSFQGIYTAGGVNGLGSVLQVSPSAAFPTLYLSPGLPRWDYHLVSSFANPAINNSAGSNVTVDLDGNPRIGVPDLGAYEAIPPVRRVPGSYFGDSRADLAIYSPRNGIFIYAQPDGSSPHAVAFGGADPSFIPVPGDYFGDGKTDLAIYSPKNGIFEYAEPDGSNPRVVAFGGADPSFIPIPGDYFGDGKTDLAIYSPRNGIFEYAEPDGSNPHVVVFGGADPSFVPVPGDDFGEGKTSLAIYSPKNGLFEYAHPDGSGAQVIAFGGSDPSFIAIPGDYFGEGKASLAIYSPKNGLFEYAHADGSGAQVVAFGGSDPSFVPIPGDYFGEGKTALGIYSPKNGIFEFAHPDGSGAQVVAFGGPDASFVPPQRPVSMIRQASGGGGTHSVALSTRAVVTPAAAISPPIAAMAAPLPAATPPEGIYSFAPTFARTASRKGSFIAS